MYLICIQISLDILARYQVEVSNRRLRWLGLSECCQQQSGGISLESIFIDEGLDPRSNLEQHRRLLNLKSTGRMVGIAHVSELKNRIPLVLEVKSDQYRSFNKIQKN